MERNVGGYDRIARAALEPVLIVVGATSLTGFLAIVVGVLGLATAVAALLVGAVLATTAVTQKCPPNDLLGIGTCEGTATAGTRSAGKPRAQWAFLRLVTRTRPDRRVYETGD